MTMTMLTRTPPLPRRRHSGARFWSSTTVFWMHTPSSSSRVRKQTRMMTTSQRASTWSTWAGGRRRAAVVRYVGELGGRPSVGIEFVAPFARGHDGYCESCGARGFTCEPGRGLYLSETGAAKKLLPVTDVDHSNEEWRQAVQDIMQHLEQRAHSAGEATPGRSSAAPEKEVVEFNYISMRQLTRGIERLECLAPQQSQDIFNRFGGRVGHLSQADFIAAWSRWQAVRLPRDLAAIRSSALKRFRAPPRPQGDNIRFEG